jgi:aspartate 1-decarboxylase
MRRTFLHAKLHRARVTTADSEYEGSLALDAGLMEACGLMPFEMVHVYNVTNGERFSTYLIRAERDSGRVDVFGAAALKAAVGDVLIIAAYAELEDEEAAFLRPRVLILDERNRIKDRREA